MANRPCTGWTSDVQGSDGQSPRAKSPTHDERARAPAGERRAGTLDSDGTLNLPLRQRGRRKASSLTIAEPMPRLLTTLELRAGPAGVVSFLQVANHFLDVHNREQFIERSRFPSSVSSGEVDPKVSIAWDGASAAMCVGSRILG